MKQKVDEQDGKVMECENTTCDISQIFSVQMQEIQTITQC